MMKIKSTKIWILLGIVVCLIMLLFSTIAILRAGRTKVIIETSPDDAKISIQGRKASEKNYLSAGDYTIKVERQGFKAAEKKISIRKGDKEKTVIIVPQAEAEGLELLAKNPKVQRERESLAGQETQEAGTELYRQNPLISRLPYENPQLGFSLDYAKDTQGNAVIEVRGNNPFARKYALQQIQEWGYSTTDYRFKFVDLLNVFEARK